MMRRMARGVPAGWLAQALSLGHLVRMGWKGAGWALAAMVVSSSACDSLDEGTRHDFEDQGTVCMTLEGDVLEVSVRFPTCLSSSCSRALDTSCQFSSADGVLELTSQGAYESTGANECTDDCGALTARCSSTGIAPGEYELRHGDERATVTVGEERVCVFGDGFL
jgi:hypothetical protein